ncbi:MAG: alpha/beta fold hydrolase [Cyanobacteria bacterium J06638_22]
MILGRLHKTSSSLSLKARIAIALTALSTSLIAVAPSALARSITLSFGPFQRRIHVEDLEAFATDGRLQNEAGFVLSQLSEEQRNLVRVALTTELEGIDPVVLSQMSYTRSGEILYQEVGSIIQTESGQNGFRSLRGAALITITDGDGFTPLNFLQNLPTDLRVDIPTVLAEVRQASRFLGDTDTAMTAIEDSADASLMEVDLGLDELEDPAIAGPITYTWDTVQFYDAERDRTLVTDIYIPEVSGEIPVILVSNGLGAQRDRFEELSAHLASHGFAVVIPDHPGSDRQWLRDFYAGLERENFDAVDFLERPRDLSFLLDELEQRNATDYGNQLDLDRVGVFGYSFGGTTALAIAGAPIDPDHLATSCERDRALFNISRLYQCRALELPPEELSVSLRDPRIAAIYLFFPFGRSLYSPESLSQVETPIFWQATDLDILTPLLQEQLPTYPHLPEENRYLAVSRGLPHARITLDVLRQLTDIPDDWQYLRELTLRYQNGMSTAFFQTYISEDDRYQPLLSHAYTTSLSEPPYRFTLVRTLPEF